MCNIQESIYESESFINEKQDLIYMLSHDLKNFAGNPQGLAKFGLEPEIEFLRLADRLPATR